jgi:DNA gyrase subunit A
MAGIKLSSGARAVWFGAVPKGAAAPVVVTVSGSSSALPGTDTGSVKVTPFDQYPPKGRGTAGVRCHRFLRGEDTLVLGWAGASPVRASTGSGAPLDLPAAVGRRDGSGTPPLAPIAAVAPAASGAVAAPGSDVTAESSALSESSGLNDPSGLNGSSRLTGSSEHSESEGS